MTHDGLTASRRSLDTPPLSEDAPTKPVKVICILAAGRSGTTLLDNILGEIDGLFSAGELMHVWDLGLIHGRRCGCGVPLKSCDLWEDVFSHAFPSSSPPADHVVRLQERVVGEGRVFSLVRRRAHAQLDPAARDYADILASMYRSLADVTGARVVVDSSKRSSHGALLRLVPGVQPYFVHLTRDPRAVAFSWRRDREQVASSSRQERRGTTSSTVQWAVRNLLIEFVRAASGERPWLHVRYEDLISQPAATLQAILEMLGEPKGPLPLEEPRVVRLNGNHTASGNRSRFRTGPVELEHRTEWMAAQRLGERAIVNALTWPLLLRYGYRVRVRAALRSRDLTRTGSHQ